MVPLTGVEPVRYCYRGILSPLRLPIPPQRQNWRRHPDSDWRIEVLQTFALPLGYGAISTLEFSKSWSGRRDSDPRHLPWQGNALPLSHSRKLSYVPQSTLPLLCFNIIPNYSGNCKRFTIVFQKNFYSVAIPFIRT